MKKAFLALCLLLGVTSSAQEPVDLVNPFIGTTNFGTCNPGAVCPSGLMSVVPFNVMGSDLNRYDKDARWWSTPYDNTNSFFTGFSHVNLSGVGCPEMGSLLLMPTHGDTLTVDYHDYGSTYTEEKATPGYYALNLSRYGITAEVTATMRTARARFSFPAGTGHILLNLGEGLTNESGATLRRTGEREICGCKLLGTFCYNPQAVFPIYFCMRILGDKPIEGGYWKKQRPMQGVEAEWDPDQGKYKLYTKYEKEISGDDVGAYFNFQTAEGEQVEVALGVSFVSVENARLNLDREQPEGTSFDDIRLAARSAWAKELNKIRVTGGSEDERTVFYTALYHILLQPNILQDVNGEYPAMESPEILRTPHNRYTVFSLWDTYRNVHQLLSLVYPQRQIDMCETMLSQYDEGGWLPKWELYGRETFTMEGDPAIPVLVDTWRKGLLGHAPASAVCRAEENGVLEGYNFSPERIYTACRKGAMTPGAENLLRPDNDDYLALSYVPLREQFDNSVSHALEYYIADASLADLAEALGKKEDAAALRARSLGYRKYYCPQYGTLRPLLPDGSFLTPFNPRQGENFEPSPGFHEGNAWNYTFYVPHDIPGLTKIMGGRRKFVEKLQGVFDVGDYDPANEPDIAYPYLFSRFKGEEWRTQALTRSLLAKYFRNDPAGIPGNDDTGTMSAWAVFSMMGFYPDCPGKDEYTLTAPVFERVEIDLDPRFYAQPTLTVTCPKAAQRDARVKSVRLGGKTLQTYRITHSDLLRGGQLEFELE